MNQPKRVISSVPKIHFDSIFTSLVSKQKLNHRLQNINHRIRIGPAALHTNIEKVFLTNIRGYPRCSQNICITIYLSASVTLKFSCVIANHTKTYSSEYTPLQSGYRLIARAAGDTHWLIQSHNTLYSLLFCTEKYISEEPSFVLKKGGPNNLIVSRKISHFPLMF